MVRNGKGPGLRPGSFAFVDQREIFYSKVKKRSFCLMAALGIATLLKMASYSR